MTYIPAGTGDGARFPCFESHGAYVHAAGAEHSDGGIFGCCCRDGPVASGDDEVGFALHVADAGSFIFQIVSHIETVQSLGT